MNDSPFATARLRSFARPAVLALVVLALVVLAGCDAFGNEDEEAAEEAAGRVLVANQGNFGDANGSVTVYNTETEQARVGLSSSQVSSTIQGALAQDGRYYVVANTARRVNVYDSETLEGLGQSDTVFTSPRYLAVTDQGVAYVTNQQYTRASDIVLLDVSAPANITVEERIPVPGSPEGITLTDARAYAALGAFSDTPLVAAIDRAQREVIEEIDIGCYARFAFTDEDGEVLLPCNDAEGNGQVVVLDGASGNERARIDLPGAVQSAGGVTQAASYAPGSEELYVVLDARRIARLDTRGTGAENTLTETVGPIEGPPLGAIGYDAGAGRLYVGHVPAFDERGSVTIHRRDGTLVGQFTAGNAPTYVSFAGE